MDQKLREELLAVLMRGVPSDLPDLEELCLDDLEAITPLIDKALADCALENYNRAHQFPLDKFEKTHDLRVTYDILGGHTWFSMRTGKHGYTLGLAGENICMTNEEFAAWRSGSMNIEFVERIRK